MNLDALRIGTAVSTAFGALGLAIVVVLFAYYRHLRSDEVKLEQIPAKDRAKVLGRYLTRYNLDASNLASDQTYELIRADIDRQTSRVMFLAIVIAATFVSCFTTASIIQRYSPARAQQQPPAAPPGDLTPVFGEVSGRSRVVNLPPVKNNEQLRRSITGAQKSIKIVTINGQSWIKSNFFADFEQASRRIPVTLMLLDFTDSNAVETFNDAMREYSGESIFPEEQFRDNFMDYVKKLHPESHLTLGLYREYPWARFTIFDDRAVSFIVTPLVESGDSVNRYYSEDPFVVRCFERIFDQISKDSEKRGSVFTDAASAKRYISYKSK